MRQLQQSHHLYRPLLILRCFPPLIYNELAVYRTWERDELGLSVFASAAERRGGGNRIGVPSMLVRRLHVWEIERGKAPNRTPSLPSSKSSCSCCCPSPEGIPTAKLWVSSVIHSRRHGSRWTCSRRRAPEPQTPCLQQPVRSLHDCTTLDQYQTLLIEGQAASGKVRFAIDFEQGDVPHGDVKRR